ncbi:S1-like domain-containing RNA-binding protein [Niallia circulans]|uniref:CvfB family protein n=1 Tax=Niallia circulans TaxID=1397 RepID=UPI0011A44AEC|nr:S1-like domain-containing RNA-binding protein [Niallia circulans]MED5098880.1 S1-like domain-containing RNA-binding protein [Niallia circulans]
MSLRDYMGRVEILTVARIASFGYFLTIEEEDEDVLLHFSETDQKFEEGDEVRVFIYSDSQGRACSSTFIPSIAVGKYDWVKVTDRKEGIGCFFDIGLKKDMLLGEDDLPVHEEVWPEVGDMLYITLKVNKNNYLYVKPATDPIIEEMAAKATREDFNKNIHGYIYRTAKVGSWIYTAEGFKGFIHESERGKEPRLGEKVNGRIIDVKLDGTVNVSLLPRKEEALDKDSQLILDYLRTRKGAMPYGDKSMPEDIKERFNLSKGSFKRALGRLMKENKVYQEEGWTYLKEDNQNN